MSWYSQEVFQKDEDISSSVSIEVLEMGTVGIKQEGWTQGSKLGEWQKQGWPRFSKAS